MGKPVLLAVDSEPDILAATQRDLSRRFAADYRIVTADAPEAAFAELDIGDQVALVMAGHPLTDTTGVVSSMRATSSTRPLGGSCSSRTEISPSAAQRCGRWRSDCSMTP
jgi:hypothetical protein